MMSLLDSAQEREGGSSVETVTIQAGDGYRLTGQLYSPTEERTGRIVVINSATGVPQRYYQRYAGFLSEQGFKVLTYDYRGIGLSQETDWQGKPLSMADWGRQDLDSVLLWLRARFPNDALMAVGHSVGGQLVGLAPNNHLLQGFVGISSQAGYVGYWSGMQKFKFRVFTSLVIPGVTRLVGDLPGAFLGGSESLPRGVARQWAHWCRSPQYMCDREGNPLREHFNAYQGKVRLYHFTDDLMYAPLKAVDTLAGFYANAEAEVLTRSPGHFGCDEIGHFGFFKREMPQDAWLETARWLAAPELESRMAKAS